MDTRDWREGTVGFKAFKCFPFGERKELLLGKKYQLMDGIIVARFVPFTVPGTWLITEKSHL